MNRHWTVGGLKCLSNFLSCFWSAILSLPSYLGLYNLDQGLVWDLQVLIAVEKQKVAEKEAETLKKRAVTDAEKDAKVSEILMSQRVREKESIKRQQEIENEIFLARERGLADANFYRCVHSSLLLLLNIRVMHGFAIQVL